MAAGKERGTVTEIEKEIRTEATGEGDTDLIQEAIHVAEDQDPIQGESDMRGNLDTAPDPDKQPK